MYFYVYANYNNLQSILELPAHEQPARAAAGVPLTPREPPQL